MMVQTWIHVIQSDYELLQLLFVNYKPPGAAVDGRVKMDQNPLIVYIKRCHLPDSWCLHSVTVVQVVFWVLATC